MLGERIRGVKYQSNGIRTSCPTNASSDLSYMSATISDGALTMKYRGVIQEMEHYHYDVFQVNHVKQDTLIYTCPLEFFTSADDGSIDRCAFRLYSQVDPILFRRVD